MVDKDVAEEVGGLKQLTPTSTCVLIEGVLAQTPPGTKQKVGAAGLGAPLPLVLLLWWCWMLLISGGCRHCIAAAQSWMQQLAALHLPAHCGVCMGCTT